MERKEKFPESEGYYWFYGDIYRGTMGKDYKEDKVSEDDIQLKFVEIRKVGNTLAGTVDGQMIFSTKFNRKNNQSGWCGYWSEAKPTPPPAFDIKV